MRRRQLLATIATGLGAGCLRLEPTAEGGGGSERDTGTDTIPPADGDASERDTGTDTIPPADGDASDMPPVSWQSSTGGSNPATSGGTLYYTRGFDLTAATISSGSVQWEQPIAASTLYDIHAGARWIYALVESLQAFDPQSGIPRWEVQPDEHVIDTVAEADSLVLCGENRSEGKPENADPRVHAVALDSGARKWTVSELPTGFIHDILVVEDVAYLSLTDTLLAYSIPDREPLARDTGIGFGATLRADGDTLYVANSNGVRALGLGSLEERWEAGLVPAESPPVLTDETLVFGSDGAVVALDRASGRQKWTGPTEGRIFEAPAVVGGYVWATDQRSTLYGFDLETGDRRFQTTVKTDDGLSAVVAAEGTLVSVADEVVAYDLADG